MYGFEYQAAVNLLLAGKVEKGFELIRSIRFRHDGERRNPWNEMECGSNYARSMAAYSILLAISGFEFDMTRGHIGFRPLLNETYFKTFWSVNDAWGTFERDADGAILAVLYGSLTLKSLRADVTDFAKVVVDGTEIGFQVEGGRVLMSAPVLMCAGSTLSIR